MFSLIAAAIQKGGLIGVALLMLIENLVPVIPSELIMPMAGYDAARGAFSPFWAAVAGGVASILGGIAWYAIGRALGLDRLRRLAAHSGRWLPFTAGDVDRGDRLFLQWGAAIVCVGRALPGIRGFICIPAGVAKMPFGPFLLWSSIGALIWSALLVTAGYILETRFTTVAKLLDPVADVLLGVIVCAYIFRVLRYKNRPF